MNAGSSVVSASESERKISTSSTMMNRADRLSSWLPVLPDAFCWSTWMARSPARWACSPAGSCAWAILARSPFTRSVSWFWPPLNLASTTSCSACPSGERPRSLIAVTVGTWRNWAVSAPSALTSAADSGALVRATTTGTGCRLLVPNGSASVAACMLGALAGRNLVLLPCVTLDNDGNAALTTNAATSQAGMTIHQNRAQNRPMALKMASTCMGRDGTRSRLPGCNDSQRPLSLPAVPVSGQASRGRA